MDNSFDFNNIIILDKERNSIKIKENIHILKNNKFADIKYINKIFYNNISTQRGNRL